MLAAVLAVTIIAMAGVGYAAVKYTATTVNSNNAMDQTYIKLSQSADEDGIYSTDGFLKDIYFDTVTDATTTTYTPVFTHVMGAKEFTLAGEDDTANAAVASVLLSLTVGQKNNPAESIDLKVTTEGFNTNGLVYYMAVTGNGATAYKEILPYNNGWEFTGISLAKGENDDTTVTVQLFVTGSTTAAWSGITGASFKFVATATDLNA